MNEENISEENCENIDNQYVNLVKHLKIVSKHPNKHPSILRKGAFIF